MSAKKIPSSEKPKKKTGSSSQTPPPADFQFSAENTAKLQKLISHYPSGRQRSVMLAAFDLAQRQCGGWLPQAAIEEIARLLQLTPMQVLEVASFYTMVHLKPVGRYHIQVCTTTPCQLCGGDEILQACRERLKIDVDHITPNGLFSLAEVECLGACVNAPVVQINDDYYEDLTPQKMREILEAHATGKKISPGPQVKRQTSAPVTGLTTLKTKIK